MTIQVSEYAREYADTRVIEGLTTLPDGTAVYAASRDGSYELYTPDKQLTDTDTDLTRPHWSEGRSTILALRDTDGTEMHDIVEVNPESGDVTPLIDDENANFAPRPSPTDPTQVAFISNRHGSLDLYTLDTESGDVTHRSTNDGEEPVQAATWSPDGDYLVYESGVYGGTNLRIVDLDAGTDEIFIDEPNSDQYLTERGHRRVRQPDAWSSDGILFATNHETGYLEIAVADPSGDYELVHVTEYDKTCPQWTADGDIVFTRPNQGDNEVHLLTDGEETAIAPRHDNRHPTTNDGDIFYVQERPDTAGDVMRNGSTLAAEGRVDAPTVEPEKVTYESGDGQEIHARLYTPEGDPIGAVVRIHGGPRSQAWNRLDPYAQTLVQAGFEVLAPDYRGSIGYGRDFRTAQYGDVGGVDVADVVAGARYLREERGHSHVGSFGYSFGGYLSLMVVATSDEFDMGCDVCGIVNWKTLYENSRGYAVQAIQSLFGGSPEELPEFYEERSPITHADEIDVPLVVVQGENDPRVPVSEAEQIVAALEERDIPHEYYLVEGEGHFVRDTDRRAEYLLGTISLFESAVGE